MASKFWKNLGKVGKYANLLAIERKEPTKRRLRGGGWHRLRR